MSARTVRITKEVRTLFWPWCVVVVVGASPVVLPHRYAEPFSFLSFFLGLPLLAIVSLGNEFHHRTLSLWLAQPLSRIELWAEKMMVMWPAVLSAGLVSGTVMFSVTWPNMRLTYKVAAVVYVVVSAASATFLTLVTRSTLGSLPLIWSVLFVGMLFSGGVGDEPHASGGLMALLSPAATVGALATFGFCFSALMLWLGARKLESFQATGATSGEDLLTAGPSVVPEAFAEAFRCRPSGALLNLIRKECRLLRPLWLVGLLIVMYVGCLALFRLLPAPPVTGPRSVLEWALWGPLVSVCIAMAGLAGILSLGEERTSGTYAWHMTLPISAGRQWLIKLVMAMFAGLACSMVFPVLTMIAGGAVHGSPLMYVNVHALPDDLILFSILTFTCFWCACAANGTVRAAIWTLPVTAGVSLASAGGLWLGEELSRTTGTLRDLVVSRFHLSPLALAGVTDLARARVLWLFVPALLAGLIQSYWLFRRQPQENAWWILRCTRPLVAVTILWSFSASAGFVSSRWEPFDEIGKVLERSLPTTAKLELTGEDLGQGPALSPLTERWLKGSSITVAPGNSRPSVYRATIHLAGGLECKLIVTPSGGTAASCGY